MPTSSRASRVASPLPIPPIPKPPVGSSQACQQCEALRLENAALRWRIQELEHANEELLKAAGQIPSSSSVDRVRESSSGNEFVEPPGGSSDCEKALCPNCQREVPAANLSAHMIHCERNFGRCSICGEVVPIREVESHKARWTDPAAALEAARRCHGDGENDQLALLRNMRAHGLQLQEITCEESGSSLLHCAASQRSVALLSLLLGCGHPTVEQLSVLNSNGQAALHAAVLAGSESAALLLLEIMANIEQSNGAGDTPLLLACRSGDVAIVRRLVEAAADLNARTALGDTALQVAQASGNMDAALALGGGLRRFADSAKVLEAEAVGPPLRPGATSGSPGNAAHQALPGMRLPATPLTGSRAASREASLSSRPLMID